MVKQKWPRFNEIPARNSAQLKSPILSFISYVFEIKMLSIILLVSLAAILALIKKTGGVLNPVVLIFIFFYGLLACSQLSITGLPVPSVKGTSYFLLAFVSASVGALLAGSRGKVDRDSVFDANKKTVFWVVFYLCLMPLLYVFYENIKFILGSGYEAYVIRSRFLGDGVTVAGSTAMASIIDRVSRPLAIVAIVIGAAMVFSGKDKRLFWVGTISLSIFSFLYVKRIDLMYALVIYASGLLAKRAGEGRKEFYKGMKSYLLLAALVLFILTVSSFRASSYGAYELFMHYGVGYHSYGFSLFDYALNNSESHMHDFVFPGRSFFATFDFMAVQFLKIFGVEYSSVFSALYSDELGQSVFMGVNSFSGDDLSPNAFYTSLYPVYRDFKEVGLLIVPFVYGYIFSREYMTYRLHRNLRSLVWTIFLAWVGYASLLTPVVMGNTFWLIPLMIFIMFRLRVSFAWLSVR